VHRQTLQHNAGRLRAKPGCDGIVGELEVALASAIVTGNVVP
jgi:hypothetical protein